MSSYSRLEHNIEARRLVEERWPQTPVPDIASPPPKGCAHKRAKCVYDSDDGEFERWECPDCGERWGVEIPQ